METENKPQQYNSFLEIYKFYVAFIQNPSILSHFQTSQLNCVFPIVPIPTVLRLNDAVSQIFCNEPNLLSVNCEVNVIGDLHGHIFDLFRILKNIGFPPEKNYLFLGDFVDRGEFSIETIIFIFVLKVLFPKNIYIIRGNHEFADMFARCGFSNELENVYNAPILNTSFNNAFSLMPLAAIVNDSILCVHGGIGPELTTLGQISEIKRPIMGFDNALISSLVWSDPSPATPDFSPSARGLGYLFGFEPLNSFLTSQSLDLIVRGHECVKGGIEYALESKIVTVFSASNYCGMLENKCGILILKTDKTRDHIIYPALPYIKRYQVTFVKSEDENEFKITYDFPESIDTNPLPTLNVSNSVGSAPHRPILSSCSSNHIAMINQPNNSPAAQITSRLNAMARRKPINILGAKSMSSRTPASSLRNDDLFKRAMNIKQRPNSVFKQLPPPVPIQTFSSALVPPQTDD